jgi:hypothetical protein
LVLLASSTCGCWVDQAELHALLIGAGEHDGIVKVGWPAEGDVGLQGVDQARGVDLDELLLGEVGAAAGKGEELVGVLLDGARAAEEHELFDGTIGHGRSEVVGVLDRQPTKGSTRSR